MDSLKLLIEGDEITQRVSIPPETVSDPNKIDYDFFEQPSPEFFCPVTLELLIEPHQTTCCGNHLSQEAANRLQRDGKPCPLCQKSQLSTMPDLFYKRKVNETKVRCPHNKSECQWVGGVNELKQHSGTCPKRPWQCQHCGFDATYDIGVNEHVPKCTKYPVLCPNYCEIGSVSRCNLEAHLTVCPLQPVACQYAEVGCNVKVPRRDLAHHMEEEQMQHLVSATLLILQLTRESAEERKRLLQVITDKNEENKQLQKQLRENKSHLEKQLKQLQDEVTNLQQQIQEKDKEIVEMGRQVRMFKEKEVGFKKELTMRDQHIGKQDDKVLDLQKDEAIEDLKKHLKELQDGVDAKVTVLQQQVVKYGEDTQEHLKQQDKHVEHLSMCQLQGYTMQELILTGFRKCQAKSECGGWNSEAFYSHPEGYKLQVIIDTNGTTIDVRGEYVSAWIKLLNGDYDDMLDWPMTVTTHLQLLNQLGNYNHHEKITTSNWSNGHRGKYGGQILKYIKLADLQLNADKSIQYLMNDSLRFQVFVKTRPKV